MIKKEAECGKSSEETLQNSGASGRSKSHHFRTSSSLYSMQESATSHLIQSREPLFSEGCERLACTLRETDESNFGIKTLKASKGSSMCASADQKIDHGSVSPLTSRDERFTVMRIDISTLVQEVGDQVDVSTAGSAAKGPVIADAQGCAP